MTVEDEVAFGPESLGLEPAVIADRIDWALDVVGMQAFRRRSPFELSGGQKQRVAIASILAMQPKVLVLDEPTSGLDPVGKSEVVRLVGELRDQTGMTIIMVEQDAETVAEFSDWLVILEDGKVTLEGTPREVFGQVEAMEKAGLAAPQVSQFGDLHNKRWGTGFRFVRLGEAYAALVQELAATQGGASQHE
jgi:energy-coupling factor transporter ATP-binding protein EcfA2